VTRVSGPGPGVREVVVTDLEMTHPAQLRPGAAPRAEATFVRAGRPAPELSRFFYRAVGGDWYWLDRLDWTYDQWRAWVTAPGHELWTCWVDGVPAGYVELDRQHEGDVEVAYFGLLPEFAGLGLGGWLLTRAVERAWEVPPRVAAHVRARLARRARELSRPRLRRERLLDGVLGHPRPEPRTVAGKPLTLSSRATPSRS